MNTRVKTFHPVHSFPNFFDGFLNELGSTNISRLANTSPAINVIEDGEGFKIELAAPGLKKEDFKINLEEGLLTVSAEKEKQDEPNYSRREFNFSTFSRSFRLPKSVDTDKVEASHENGILYLVLPKKEEAKPKEPRQIDVV